MTNEKSAFSTDVLRLDCAAETERIVQTLRASVLGDFKRKGGVVGISGGIDSSVVAALGMRAFGKDRMLALTMPERDSGLETMPLCRLLVDALGVATLHQDITAVLEATGCYARRDAAIREVIPEYGPGWKSKIVLPDVLTGDLVRFFSVVASSPTGDTVKVRLPAAAYLAVVAATNFKQRVRTMTEYHHADRLNYAVLGTPNRLEYDQGFFVKGGDGLADVKPIAHLYKTQVYAMAEYLGVPAEIRGRPPTTDTYSMPQSQEEFYFSLPFGSMDLCLWARSHGVSATQAAPTLGLSPKQVERVYRDIDAKRRVARYLHAGLVLIEDAAPTPAGR